MAAGDITADRAEASDKGYGASFDGVDDYVQIPHNSNQLGANLLNGFTISAWIFPKTIGESTGRILDKSEGPSGDAGFRLYQTVGNVSIQLNTGTAKSSGANSILFFHWKHILLTISSAQLVNFYVNGVLSGTANQDLVQPISAITTTNALRIGNRSTATDRTFDGIIKDVRMWNRVLTADERALDYAGTLVTDGLILNVPLQDDYKDKSPTGLTGTNSGTYLVNNLPNRIKADVNSLNLAAVTDKPIVVLPVGGRDAAPIVVGVNRSA